MLFVARTACKELAASSGYCFACKAAEASPDEIPVPQPVEAASPAETVVALSETSPDEAQLDDTEEVKTEVGSVRTNEEAFMVVEPSVPFPLTTPEEVTEELPEQIEVPAVKKRNGFRRGCRHDQNRGRVNS